MPLEVHGEVELLNVTFAYPQRPGARCAMLPSCEGRADATRSMSSRAGCALLPLGWPHASHDPSSTARLPLLTLQQRSRCSRTST